MSDPEVLARLVKCPSGRFGHWLDPETEDVYDFGDVNPHGGNTSRPEGYDESPQTEEAGQPVNPAQEEALAELEALRVENARLKRTAELNKLTVAQLLAEATELATLEGITVPADAKKDDLIEYLLTHGD